jgi:Flp pilus assembly protein TadD
MARSILHRGVVLLLAAHLLAACQAPLGGSSPLASRDDATDQRLYLSVISGLQSSGQSRAAIAYLDDYDKKYPGDPQAQLLRGEALIAIGETGAAELLFEGLLKRSYVAQGNAGLGMVRAQQSQWQQASWYFQHAASADPANPKLLNNLGYALLKNYRAGEAYAPLAQAVELDRKSTEIRNNLLLSEYWGGRRDMALAKIGEIENLNEREAVSRFVLNWNAAGVATLPSGASSSLSGAAPLAATDAASAVAGLD